MLFASEEVTKSWRKKKNLIIKSRPTPSNFSFAVCLSIIGALLCGFFGGFLVAGFALTENYGAVYEGLIAELENTRQCIEREKNELRSLREAHLARANLDQINTFITQLPVKTKQIQEQAIIGILENDSKNINKNF